MLRSLFSGITGLRAHQQLMDVVSNNIANVNTTGFKSSSMQFEDTLSQTLRAAGAPTATSGGINPAQVGLGVQMGGISTNFSQGSAQNTGKSTDVMIQGDGFFETKDSAGQTAYTRAGDFSFDSNGLLVNPEGAAVQGWSAAGGKLNNQGATGPITVKAGTQVPPTKSTKVTLGGNIAASTTTTITEGATVFDASGAAHTLSIVLTPNTTTTPQSYDISVTEPADAALPTPLTTPATGSAQFVTAANATATSPAGSLDSTASTAPTFTLADGTAIAINLNALTQYGGPSTIAVTDTDGASSGTLQSLEIGSDGTVTGVFSNNQKLALAQIALVNFNNPEGLESVGSTAFQATSNSGLPQVGVAGNGGLGTLLSNSLEMSNVDLAGEFTNMIIAQRGFEANSKVITTSDTMLQDLVDIKR